MTDFTAEELVEIFNKVEDAKEYIETRLTALGYRGVDWESIVVETHQVRQTPGGPLTPVTVVYARDDQNSWSSDWSFEMPVEDFVSGSLEDLKEAKRLREQERVAAEERRRAKQREDERRRQLDWARKLLQEAGELYYPPTA